MSGATATSVTVLPAAASCRVEEGLLALPSLALHHGGQLVGVTIAWRLAGAPGAPVVAALGGISASRLVFDAEEPGRGWWRELVGPGLPLDTTRYRVLGMDWLGGSGGTTGPRPGQQDFPAVDTRDQAAVLLAVCDALGIGRLHGFAGASYGGMVGLALAERAPQRLGHLLAISAAHRSNPLATGWRSVQRAIVRHALELGDGPGGLRIARALAMTTYRTRAEFNARFPTGPLSGAGRPEFPVERYLFARGDEFAATHRPEGFLCLSESIDLHAVDPRRIRTPVTLAAVIEDQLVTVEDVRELAGRLPAPCRLHELHSRYGHDAFLKEPAALAPVFAAALAAGSA
jgi:homoserine O-acetyltransferase